MHRSEILVPRHYDSDKERVSTELAALGVAASVGVEQSFGVTIVRVANPNDLKVVEIVAPEADTRITGPIEAQ